MTKQTKTILTVPGTLHDYYVENDTTFWFRNFEGHRVVVKPGDHMYDFMAEQFNRYMELDKNFHDEVESFFDEVDRGR